MRDVFIVWRAWRGVGTAPRLGGAILSILLLFWPVGVSAQKYRGDTTPAEIANLPKYCYAQYVNEQYSKDPLHSIQGCGAYMNHYCPGLVDFMRAQSPALAKPQRVEKLKSAKKNFEYTLKYMPQNCWLRSDAQSSMRQAEMLGMLLR